MLFFSKNKKNQKKKTINKKNNPIAIKKYTSETQKTNKEYNSIDIEWLEKKIHDSNSNRVKKIATTNQKATLKFVKELLKSDKF